MTVDWKAAAQSLNDADLCFDERVKREAVVHNALNSGLPFDLSVAHIKYSFYQVRWSTRAKSKVRDIRNNWQAFKEVIEEAAAAWITDDDIEESDLPAAKTLLAMLLCGFRANTISDLIGEDIYLVKKFLAVSWENGFWDMQNGDLLVEWLTPEGGVDIISFVCDVCVLQEVLTRKL